MTKPHEEAWGDDYEVTVVGPKLERHEDVAREALARAAPDMARALLAVLERRSDGTMHLRDGCSASRMETCDDARCHAVRAALAKAGVKFSRTVGSG
jgi:hypothetical protein